MSVLSSNSVFTSLQQEGPLAVTNNAFTAGRFSAATRKWVKALQQDPNNITKYRALRSQLFEFLAVDSIEQIQSLIIDTSLHPQRSDRALRLLGNMFGIDGNLNEIKSLSH